MHWRACFHLLTHPAVFTLLTSATACSEEACKESNDLSILVQTRLQRKAREHLGQAKGHGQVNESQPDKQITREQIPQQLIMTGPDKSLEDLLKTSKLAKNVKKTLALNPRLKIRYLSDAECQSYIQENHGDELAMIYEGTHEGHFRGDICRAAVLFNEGGFYADLDFDPLVPFNYFVDNSTQFMSVFGDDGGVLNAVMAAVPHSPVMQQTLKEILEWHVQGSEGQQADGWMGTATLRRALISIMAHNCPELHLMSQQLKGQWQCGPHTFRFHLEVSCLQADGPECPPGRRQAKGLDGLHYAIVAPGEQKKPLAWSRSSDCDSWWCGGR
mmetsp:Transcript_64634/g.114949  ORF Transcript_64634/g.114949 Transcript_64634/m.114949 type:complete len:329 (+) Transcript_64634:117-1103(+)